MVYVTLLPGAFNDPSVDGRTVRIKKIEEVLEDASVTFSFTWAENPYDVETVHSGGCRAATHDEIRQAALDYANEGQRFN